MALRPLKLLLKLDDRLSRGLTKVGRNLQKLNRPADSLARKLGSIGGALFRIGRRAALFGVGLAASLGFAVVKTISLADNLAKVAKRLGLTNAQLQELQLTFKADNVEASQLELGLKFLSNKLGKVKGSTKDLLPTLFQLSDRLHNTADAEERSAIATAYLGKVGSKLIPTLAGGSEALRRQMHEWQELGAVLSDDVIGAAERADDALDRLKAVGSALSMRLFASLIPSVDRLATKLTNWIAANRELINQRIGALGESLANAFERLANNLPTVAAHMASTARSLVTIAGAINSIGRVAHAIANPFDTSVGALQGLSAQVGAGTRVRQRGIAPFAPSGNLANVQPFRLGSVPQQVELNIRLFSDPSGKSQTISVTPGQGPVGVSLNLDRGVLMVTP